MPNINVKVSPELLQQVRLTCAAAGVSQKRLVVEAIERAVIESEGDAILREVREKLELESMATLEEAPLAEVDEKVEPSPAQPEIAPAQVLKSTIIPCPTCMSELVDFGIEWHCGICHRSWPK